MLPSWSSKTPPDLPEPDCWWQIVICALLMTGPRPCHAAADGARSANYFRLQRGQYFILSRRLVITVSASPHHPPPRARVSRHKHSSWSMMRRAATRSDTSAPHIQPGHHQVWPMMWGCLVIPSARGSRDQVLTPDTKHWQAPQPGLHLHWAPHTKSAQNIALQSPCIKLADVWLFATHGAILLRKSAQHQILGSKNPQLEVCKLLFLFSF